ncbi:permease [Bacteroidota bacterium]
MLIDQVYRVMVVSGNLLIELFPYVISGILIGEMLKLTTWLDLIYNSIKTSPFNSIFIATLLGIVSPLCTYGTIPIVLQLFKRNVPLSPLITFLSVSSLMNPQLFILTWGGINPEMALVRLLAVFVFGAFLGFLVIGIQQKYVINPALNSSEFLSKSGRCVNEKVLSWSSILKNFWSTTQYVGFYIVIGILIGAVIEVFVPSVIIFDLFNADKWYSVPLAGLLGIPLYACGGGTIPMINSLMLGGMSSGSALSFFIIGPATRFTPILALMSIIKTNYILVYVILLILYSFAAGYLYNLMM